MLVLDLQSAVAANAAAGLFLAARSLAAKLTPALPMPEVAAIIAATGVTRSRAYELRDAVLALLPTLSRPPGRPPTERTPTSDTVLGQLRGEALRFVMRNPGCVHVSTQRSRYAESYCRWVLELRARHADVPLTDFAAAILVPVGTLEDWLRPGRVAATPAVADALPEPPEPNERHAQIDTVLAAWPAWRGTFVDFCTHVRRDLRVPLGRSMIASILFAHGERAPNRRSGRSRDENASRDTFDTFFGGAQWVGDGKQLAVVVDGETTHHNLELVVDAHSGAAVGIDVRDEEDSQAVVAAFEEACSTTGEPALALLLDNKPCNHTDEVDAALGDTLRMRATPDRPQNKAHVEGAFGLFAQTVPPLVLSTRDPRDLARTIARLVATVFFCVLNRRPRRDRDGLSRVQLYGQQVTPGEREAALAALKERVRVQELSRRTRAARTDPVVRALLDEAFGRLGLLDPERHTRDAIAGYSLDVVVDSIAIFDGKRSAGTLPDGVDARYLLGIAKNVHHCHEADAITIALLRERLAARDRFLQPLVRERDSILADANDDPALALDALVDRLVRAERVIDRHFWLDAAAALFPTDDHRRAPLMRRVARRLHAAFGLRPRDRSALERGLVRRLWPLA